MCTSLQQAHQEGPCKGLHGHLFLLCAGAPVPAASVAQPFHVQALLPGPALPSVCSSLIPCHRMSPLLSNPIWPHPALNPRSREGIMDTSSVALELLEELLKHASRSCAHFALTRQTPLSYNTIKAHPQQTMMELIFADATPASQKCWAQVAIRAAKAAQSSTAQIDRRDPILIPDRQADRQAQKLQPPGRSAGWRNPAGAVAKVVLTGEAQRGQGAGEGSRPTASICGEVWKQAEPQPSSLWGVSQRWQP